MASVYEVVCKTCGARWDWYKYEVTALVKKLSEDVEVKLTTTKPKE